MALFDFLGRKVSMAEISTVIGEKANQVYFKKLALHIAVSYIANTLSKCEFKVYENGEEVQNELYYALNINPNPNQNSSQFVNKIIEKLYYTDGALVVPFKNKLYVADNFQVEEKPWGENIFRNIQIEEQVLHKSYKASEVFYFKLDSENVKRLVEGMYGSYEELLTSAMTAYKRLNGRKYKLILENYKAGDTEFANLFETVIKKQLEAFINNDNTVYPQFKGTNLEEIGGTGGTASSADIIALRKEIFDTTAQAFKIPLSMMYGNITDMNEIVKVYLSICIDPIADMISEELTRKTADFAHWSKGNYIRLDTSRINHVDVLDVADKADKAISCGAFCIDEIRQLLGFDALNTEFSQTHFVTKNYANAEDFLHEVLNNNM